jgi:hypothetical protein
MYVALLVVLIVCALLVASMLMADHKRLAVRPIPIQDIKRRRRR